MTGILDCLDSLSKFVSNIDSSILSYQPTISDRFSCEAGNFEKLSYLVLAKFCSHLSCIMLV